MEVRRLGTLALETFKTLNDLNSAFMKNLFAKRDVSKKRKTTQKYQTETLSNSEIRV